MILWPKTRERYYIFIKINQNKYSLPRFPRRVNPFLWHSTQTNWTRIFFRLIWYSLKSMQCKTKPCYRIYTSYKQSCWCAESLFFFADFGLFSTFFLFLWLEINFSRSFYANFELKGKWRWFCDPRLGKVITFLSK